MPDIKSRCGFCSLEMNTWLERVDHLGDHFKIGATMADWKGDWGFDNAITQMVRLPYDYPLEQADPFANR